MMMRLQPPRQAPLTGFSERVSLDQVAKITQNEGIIAHVSVTENGKPWTGQELYLRGTALDVYTGLAPRRSGLSWQWIFWLNVPIGLLVIPLAWSKIGPGFWRTQNLALQRTAHLMAIGHSQQQMLIVEHGELRVPLTGGPEAQPLRRALGAAAGDQEPRQGLLERFGRGTFAQRRQQ